MLFSIKFQRRENLRMSHLNTPNVPLVQFLDIQITLEFQMDNHFTYFPDQKENVIESTQ